MAIHCQLASLPLSLCSNITKDTFIGSLKSHFRLFKSTKEASFESIKLESVRYYKIIAILRTLDTNWLKMFIIPPIPQLFINIRESAGVLCSGRMKVPKITVYAFISCHHTSLIHKHDQEE